MAEDGNGFTNKEILIRLEQKVDKVLDDHEKRIRLLEKFKYGIPASLVASVAAVVGALLHS